jgi:predicted dehydrogenase
MRRSRRYAPSAAALYDVGGYAILAARMVFGREPQRGAGICTRDPQSGCDVLTSALLDFDVGQASFVVGTQQLPYQRVHIFGTSGHIDIEIPFNTPHDRPCKVYVDDGIGFAAGFRAARCSPATATRRNASAATTPRSAALSDDDQDPTPLFAGDAGALTTPAAAGALTARARHGSAPYADVVNGVLGSDRKRRSALCAAK